MTDLTWAESQLVSIIERLRSGDPEPLIEFIRDDGDMSKFDSWQLDVIESVLRGETESYFQTKRREVFAKARERFNEVEYSLKTNPKYVRHEQEYPGRIANFMDQAVNLLNDAERMIPAMAPGPQQKALWVAFRRTLEAAYHFARQALWDPDVQRAIAWQTAVEKKRGPRWPELDDDIRAVLEADPKASDKDIWNKLPDPYSNRKYYVDVDDDKIINDSGRQLQRGGFKKRVSKIRKEIKKPR